MLLICVLLMSCAERLETSGTITESKAIELAKKEAARNGCKVEDYRISAVNDTNKETWTVYFKLKAQFPPPGSDHIVTVERKTGSAVFMPGE